MKKKTIILWNNFRCLTFILWNNMMVYTYFMGNINRMGTIL